MSGSFLYYLDFYITPGIFVLGIIMTYFHLKRGKVNLAKRNALALPMLISYLTWFRLVIPYALYYDPNYILVLLITILAFTLYPVVLLRLYPNED
ncbi:hypothetical protein [Thermococcus sp.]|uniref:hypothetical protein n=1 Tax=Thermococcus sp. TaxID=35749 RepID=UPI002618DC3F|nr:hypothetical protein [Thermococcus sp.]